MNTGLKIVVYGLPAVLGLVSVIFFLACKTQSGSAVDESSGAPPTPMMSNKPSHAQTPMMYGGQSHALPTELPSGSPSPFRSGNGNDPLSHGPSKHTRSPLSDMASLPAFADDGLSLGSGSMRLVDTTSNDPLVRTGGAGFSIHRQETEGYDGFGQQSGSRRTDGAKGNPFEQYGGHRDGILVPDGFGQQSGSHPTARGPNPPKRLGLDDLAHVLSNSGMGVSDPLSEFKDSAYEDGGKAVPATGGGSERRELNIRRRLVLERILRKANEE